MLSLTMSATYRLPKGSLAKPSGPGQVVQPGMGVHVSPQLPVTNPVAKSAQERPVVQTAVARTGVIAIGMIESPRSPMITSSTVLFFLILVKSFGIIVSTHFLSHSSERHRAARSADL